MQQAESLHWPVKYVFVFLLAFAGGAGPLWGQSSEKPLVVSPAPAPTTLTLDSYFLTYYRGKTRFPEVLDLQKDFVPFTQLGGGFSGRAGLLDSFSDRKPPGL
ncbi:MAG: hypothetical protein HC913_11490 [Microscillaceae bacterium]|nr:hypothetical protein [Microscillaceae bacterium]